MYDVPRVQMDGGAKCTLINNINLLKNIWSYKQWFCPKARMRGATSNNVIVLQVEGLLQIPTIWEGKWIDVCCYYSTEFTSTFLSNNDVLNYNKFRNEYCGQSMLKFFIPAEDMPKCQRNCLRNQKLDSVIEQYNHNYGNCILSCTHKKRFNINVYIPGIIYSGLCYTMTLIIPSWLPLTDPSATVLNLREKAYAEDQDFKKKYNLILMQLIYDHQQQEHIKLLNDLESVSTCFHKLPLHSWIHHNTPINYLTKKAHEMIWHQGLIHLSP